MYIRKSLDRGIKNNKHNVWYNKYYYTQYFAERTLLIIYLIVVAICFCISYFQRFENKQWRRSNRDDCLKMHLRAEENKVISWLELYSWYMPTFITFKIKMYEDKMYLHVKQWKMWTTELWIYHHGSEKTSKCCN